MQKDTSLIIDTREKHLIEILKKRYTKLVFSVQQLDIGDIHVLYKGILVVVIERKTIADLIASIKDGRYREQKLRLKALLNINKGNIYNQDNQNISNIKKQYIKPKIIYLIEGKISKNINKNRRGISVSTIWSVFSKLIMRDGFVVFRTRTLKESSIFINKITEKTSESFSHIDELIKNKIQHTTQNENGEYINNKDSDGSELKQNQDVLYVSSIKVKKKDNLTPGICYMRQLCQIPGISALTASKIMNIYPTLPSLLKAYFDLDKHIKDGCNGDINVLSNNSEVSNPIIIKQKKELLTSIYTSKTRKIGKKLSERVYNYLFNRI